MYLLCLQLKVSFKHRVPEVEEVISMRNTNLDIDNELIPHITHRVR